MNLCMGGLRKLTAPGWTRTFLQNSFSFSSSIPLQVEGPKTEGSAEFSATIPYGQPSFATHPHLLQSDELIPGFKKSEFSVRRAMLVELLHQRFGSKNRIVIIPSGQVRYSSGKIPFVFRQDSNFLYYTGCQEPDSVLVLFIKDNGTYLSYLFLRENDEHSLMWEGPRTGPARATNFFGVSESYPIDQFHSVLQSFTSQCSKNCDVLFSNNSFKTVADDVTKVVEAAGIKVFPINPIIDSLRLFKSTSEQEMMRKVCKLGSETLTDTMQNTNMFKTEHQLYAYYDYLSRFKGADMLAYPPVVAVGSNACIIHYIKNYQALSPNDLILVDAGCQLSGYCSDISRTWPVSGKFSDAHKTLFEVVSKVQDDLVRSVTDLGNLDTTHLAMVQLLGAALLEAHVLNSRGRELKIENLVELLCPHHVGHYLGMDVHDTPSISRSVPFAAGMVITIEPGLYISSSTPSVHKEFRGIGIRIEDDILITSRGKEVLTTTPKHVKSIEKLMTSSAKLQNKTVGSEGAL